MPVHEIIALDKRIAERLAGRLARKQDAPVRPFSLERIRNERFVADAKYPDKGRERVHALTAHRSHGDFRGCARYPLPQCRSR